MFQKLLSALFPPSIDHARIQTACARAQHQTSSPIHVEIATRPVSDALAEAEHAFRRLALHRTPQRNAVLFFLAPQARRFAILGDCAVLEHCGEAFRREVAESMKQCFRKRDFTGGLERGIAQAAALLEPHFPAPNPPAPGPLSSGLSPA
jgi:uncharacterized membrane protein